MRAVRVLTEREAAEILGADTQMLKIWRDRDDGPKWIHCGGLIRYLSTDLHAYLRNERRRTQQLAERLDYAIEAARRTNGANPTYMQASFESLRTPPD